MASEKEPFVPINTNLKPYEITIPPPNDYNKGERRANIQSNNIDRAMSIIS